jgi:hypothetical protein
MQTECSAKASEFARVEGRPVVAEFDGGALTSEAGGLLLGAADKAIRLVERLAGCFGDARRPELIEHTVATLDYLSRIHRTKSGVSSRWGPTTAGAARKAMDAIV